MPLRRRSTAQRDVLSLDVDQADWLHQPAGGPLALGAAPITGPSATELAAAAVAARAMADAGCEPVVLALTAGLVSLKLITTPDLPRRSLRPILARKAAAAANCDLADLAFAAVRCDEGERSGAPGAAREARWAVAALRRSRLRELMQALRAADVRVQRVVCAQLAFPTRALEYAAGSNDACVAIGLDRHNVHVALLAQRSLVNLNLLEGSFERNPAVALGLLQEVRTVEAFWRKHSRGGNVGTIALLGSLGDRAQLLAHSLQAAFPTARVVRPEVPPGLHPGLVGRAQILGSATATGGFQLDLALPLSAKPRALAAAGAAFVACVGVAGTIGYAHTHGRELELRDELARLARAGAELDALQQQESDVHARIEELGALTERNAALLEGGWPLRAVLEGTIGALGADAGLVALRAGRWDRGRELSIEGLTAPHPFAAMQRVARVRAALEADPLLAIDAEEALGPGGDGGSGYRFAFEARAEEEP